MISNYLLYLNALSFDKEVKQLFILIACTFVLFTAFIIFMLLKIKSYSNKKNNNRKD